jgi:hypothetical protein
VEFQARSDLTVALTASTLIVTESRMIGVVSGGGSAPRLLLLDIQPPADGSGDAIIHLQSANLPSPATGYTVTLEAQENLGSGWSAWLDITNGGVSPLPTASNSATLHTWPTGPVHVLSGALYVTKQVRAKLVLSGAVVDSLAIQGGWAYETGTGGGREVAEPPV